MNSKSWHTVEFDKTLARLAAHAAFSASEELARRLEPSTDPEQIARWQGETTEARALLAQHSEMSVGGARDVRPLARNARIGALLSPLDLLEIRQTLLAARALRRALSKLTALYPRLAANAARLEEVPAVVDAVARAINDRGEVDFHRLAGERERVLRQQQSRRLRRCPVIREQHAADALQQCRIARKPSCCIEARRQRTRASERDAAVRRAHTINSAKTCRSAHRAAGVGTEREIDQRRGDRRRRAAR